MIYHRGPATPMFYGDRSFGGAPILCDVCLFVGFLTAVLHFAQDPSFEIPLLDFVQTIFCWPSFLEGFFITLCLWAFRHIERMLGLSGFIAFLLYNALAFIPAFLAVLEFKGFHARFSLLGFIPHSLHVFALWRLPAVLFSDPLTDKFVISLSMFLVFMGQFPYSILSYIAAIGGYYGWTSDVLKIRKFFVVRNQEISLGGEALDQEEQPLISTRDEDSDVQTLIQLGMTAAQARAALARHNGDMEVIAGEFFG